MFLFENRRKEKATLDVMGTRRCGDMNLKWSVGLQVAGGNESWF